MKKKTVKKVQKKKDCGVECGIITVMIAILVAVGFAAGITHLMDDSPSYSEGQCYKHDDLDTYAKIESVEEDTVHYRYASYGVGDDKENSYKFRYKEDFGWYYTTKVDCRMYETQKTKVELYKDLKLDIKWDLKMESITK